MKAPLSKRIQKILSSQSDSRALLETMIKGERTGSHTVTLEGKTYSVQRVAAHSDLPRK